MACTSDQNMCSLASVLSENWLNVSNQLGFLLVDLFNAWVHDLLVRVTDDSNDEVQEDDCIAEDDNEPEYPHEDA